MSQSAESLKSDLLEGIKAFSIHEDLDPQTAIPPTQRIDNHGLYTVQYRRKEGGPDYTHSSPLIGAVRDYESGIEDTFHSFRSRIEAVLGYLLELKSLPKNQGCVVTHLILHYKRGAELIFE